MKPKKADVQSLLIDELKYCATGSFEPNQPSIDQAIFKARLVAWNARQAESLLLEGGYHPLQAVRTFLMRGYIQEASQLLKELKHASTDPLEFTEINLEWARLSCLLGQWKEAKEICDESLANTPSGVTLMNFHSIRSVACFELGMFDLALKNLTKLEAMYTIYPHTVFKVYASVLKAKLLARERGVEEGHLVISQVVENLRASEGFSVDNVLAILRAKSDLAFLEGASQASLLSLAGHFLAEKIGDPLYADLGLLEYYVAMGRKSLSFSRFDRVNALVDEIQGEAHTTTGKLLKEKYKAIEGLDDSNSSATGMTPKVIVLSQFQVVINLEKLVFKSCTALPKLIETLVVLSAGSISKRDLFQKIWSPQKYSSHLHDPLIRVHLSRLRKELGVSVISRRGSISLEGVLVV